jgi:hypothetical protein
MRPHPADLIPFSGYFLASYILAQIGHVCSIQKALRSVTFETPVVRQLQIYAPRSINKRRKISILHPSSQSDHRTIFPGIKNSAPAIKRALLCPRLRENWCASQIAFFWPKTRGEQSAVLLQCRFPSTDKSIAGFSPRRTIKSTHTTAAAAE